MNRVFFRTLADILDAGGSADLLTILAGEREGRALTAQKALVTADGLVPYDEGLRGLWEKLAAALPGGDRPLSAEVLGVRLLAERLSARRQLIICGGGHIAKPLAEIGSLLDFDVTVIDDREEFANRERFPRAGQVLCMPFAQAMESVPYTDGSYFVIITRGHADDRLCLERILPRRFAYCGMIGSRKKVAVVMEQMEREGYTREQLARVHSPIGLRIGAETPAEIAVCIAAEIIQVGSGLSAGSVSREGLERLARGEPMMLATIIEKRGSAPRGSGSKLLADGKGALYGTIGGGAAEARVVASAPEVLASGAPRVVLCDMTNNDARQAGMVCGGTVEVLLDPIL